MANERYRLVMKSGPNPGKVFELNMDLMSVGREATNDIVIQDSEISRNHARITRRGNNFLLEDLGSTNGTFINRQRVLAPRALAPGDEVGFGENVVLTFGGEGAAPTIAASTARGGRQAAPPPPPAQGYAPAAAAPAPKKGGNRIWIAGCGCLIVLCIVLAIGAYIFNSYNGTGLYCTAPFNQIFGALGYCPVP